MGLRCEAPREELFDRPSSGVVQEARSRAAELRVTDDQLARLLPGGAVPAKPFLLLLIEDEERLVAELREFRTPARAALDGIVLENLADDVDLLAVVDLVPDRLQHLSKQPALAVVAEHEAAY